LDPGAIAVIVVKDDAAENLTEGAKAACESLGSSKIRQVGYRDSWCIIGEKGAEKGSVPETHRSADNGPTDTIHKIVDMNARRKKTDISNIENFPMNSSTPATAAVLLGPSGGRWLRRRKNDGALNRVPPDFYPKVWKVLSRCSGILVGRELLPRDPTVSEKTPSEFNFALQVESLLDFIRDPAERQIAVECLVVISRIDERNPEIGVSGEIIDLLRIVKDAVNKFWIKWVSEVPISSTTSPNGSPSHGKSQEMDGGDPTPSSSSSFSNVKKMASPDRKLEKNTSSSSIEDTSPSKSRLNNWKQDLTFEKNEKLARRLFFDLPQDGKDGVSNFSQFLFFSFIYLSSL